MAEVVGTVILVAIVVAAAAAFSLFVASYQSQLQKEEGANHDRLLEGVRILSVSVTTTFDLTVNLVSDDVEPMNLTAFVLDGFAVQQWTIQPEGSAHSITCNAPGNDTCHALRALQQITLVLTGTSGPLTYPISLGVLTERLNDFRFSFVPPVAIAKVSFVSNGTGSLPVFDGAGSFQPSGGDNASIIGFNWTFVPANHSRSTTFAFGEDVEINDLTPSFLPPPPPGGTYSPGLSTYSVTLSVTNTDGLVGTVVIMYTAPP